MLQRSIPMWIGWNSGTVDNLTRQIFGCMTGARLLNKMATLTNEWDRNIRWKLLSKRVLHRRLVTKTLQILFF